MKRSGTTILLLLLLSSLPLHCLPQEELRVVNRGEHRLPMQARDGLIYVKAEVNGIPAKLLVDTGAVLSIFTIKVVPAIGADVPITINTAKGSIAAHRRPVGFMLGNPEQREQRCSFHLNAVVGDFAFLDADGVVGLDALARFKSVTFDFKHSVLVLEHP